MRKPGQESRSLGGLGTSEVLQGYCEFGTVFITLER